MADAALASRNLGRGPAFAGAISPTETLAQRVVDRAFERGLTLIEVGACAAGGLACRLSRAE